MANGDPADPATLPARTAAGDPMPALVEFVPTTPVTSVYDWPAPSQGPQLPHGLEMTRIKYEQACADEAARKEQG